MMTDERKAELWQARVTELKSRIKELEDEISILRVEKQMLVHENKKLKNTLSKTDGREL